MQADTTTAIESGPMGQLVALLAPGDSSPPLAVVSGERGSGRTTLVRDLAASSALDTLWIDCTTFAADQPLRSLRDAVATRVDPLFPAAMAAALGPGLVVTDADADEVASHVWSVIRDGIAALAGRIVVADDFDLLDPMSRAVTCTVLRRVAQLGTPVVLSVDAAADLPELSRQPVVELRGLDTDATRRLIEDLVGSPTPWRTAHRLTRRTGGNPLAIVDIVSSLTADQLSGRELLPHPLPLSAGAARRLTVDDPPPVRLLLAALATEEQLSGVEAEALVDGPDGLAPVLAAERIRLVNQTVTPRVPVQALAAWTLLGTPDRQQVHSRLAGAVTGADGCTMHKALAGDAVPASELVAAAARRYATGSHECAAAALAVLGHALPADGLSLAWRLMADGYITSVSKIIDANATVPGELSEEAAAAIESEITLLTGRSADRLPLSAVDPVPDHVTPDWTRGVLNSARALIHRGDPGAALDLLDATAPGFDAAPAAARALARFVRAEAGYQRQEAWAMPEFGRAALAWYEADDTAYTIGTAVMLFHLLAAGDTALASSILDRTAPAASAGALDRVAHLFGRIQIELVRGNYGAADNLVERLDRALPYTQGGAQTLAFVVQTSAALGRSEVRDRIEWRLDHPDIVLQPPQARSELAAARGLRDLVDGDADQAVQQLTLALRSRSSLYSGATATLANLLEADRSRGSTPAQSRRLMQSLGGWWPDQGSLRYASLRARCEALCTEDRGLDAAFATALELSHPDYPIDLARTRLAYGRCLRLAGRVADGDRELRRARVLFEGERLSGWLAHLDRMLAGGGAPAPRDEALTPTERQIVRLVLQRRTNTQIAQSLYLSKRTVELHLTHIFRKLGVGRKSELVELEIVQQLAGADL